IVCALYSLRSRLFFSCAGEHRDLHSFPTRRSSDLLCSIHRWRWVELEATSFLVDRVGATMRAMPCTLLACRVNIGSPACPIPIRSEEHTSELQSRENLVCRLLLEKKKQKHTKICSR